MWDSASLRLSALVGGVVTTIRATHCGGSTLFLGNGSKFFSDFADLEEWLDWADFDAWGPATGPCGSWGGSGDGRGAGPESVIAR